MPTRSVVDTRREQMFPLLQPKEGRALATFCEVRSFRPGEALVRVGDAGRGLSIILASKVDITQHDSGRRVPITTHEAGAFMGKLAQLSGRPSLVDAHVQGAVEALIIPLERLRAAACSRSGTRRADHIAIQEAIGGSAVDWVEHVTDERYLADPSNDA